MKKIRMKPYFTLLLIVSLLLSVTCGYAQAADSQAQVEFTAGIGPTYPVDPEDPDTDNETELPIGGSLAILSISDFDFGSIELTARGGLYDIVTENPNIQVVDLRGSGTGWSVTAEVSEFKSGGVGSLPGSSIHIYKGRPNSISQSLPPVQLEDVELTADGMPKKVITAAIGAGAGLWVMRWYPGMAEPGAYVQLEVPAGVAQAGTHTATINWTLADTP